MKKFLPSLLGALAFLFVTSSAFANDYVKFKGWKQAETQHFRFIYEEASEEAAKKYAEFADEAWEKIAAIYSMPQEKTDVYVFSRLNIVNAYTFFTPPEIVMYDSPLMESTFGFRDDWMKLFFTHELIHIANITFEDKNYLSSKIFGEAMRGMDYSSIPGWALEGLTTVLETELTNGGRGRSPYFELNFKGPTLDNNFIPYRLIGTEQEPPYSQIYVMGYLIMRGIADRYGIQALADIERNRIEGRTWQDSVKFVTGQTPEDIYREVKIALEKKYNGERRIPEGKIISPNDRNSNYYNPAIVFDDGSMIAIQESTRNGYAAIFLDPGKKDGTKFYDEDSKELKESILFQANFYDSHSLTADENKTVYFAAASNRYDRNPGNERQYNLYKWTKETDIIQLTNGENSFYQPAVSRDGKILVAVEQKGLKLRLVQIDTQSGEKSVLFEDERYSFIQPALNADGTELAFVLLKDDRACIALADLATKEYKIVNNTDYDFITDPSSPSFNKDGSLTFCSNDRGRLEVFEVSLNSDGKTFSYTPAVSDPIGVLWAYKNDMGIFYTSLASTGSVIKIKPLEEWKKVPDFEGPSPAGQIMTFSQYERDFPDFDPYKKKAEVAQEDDSTTDDKVKHRSQEKISMLENLPPAQKELTNEKIFFGKITPLLYSPFISLLSDKNNSYLGIGGFFAAQTARLQMRQGLIFMDAFYYPKIKNFTADFFSELPLGSGILDLYFGRQGGLIGLPGFDGNSFSMNNIALAGYKHPLWDRDDIKGAKSISLLFYTGGLFSQQSTEAFALNADIPFNKNLAFHTGFDYSELKRLQHNNYVILSTVNLLLGSFDFEKKKLFTGYEGELSLRNGINNSVQQASIVLRYTDFPSQTVPFLSRAHLPGLYENCTYPGKILFNYAYIIPGLLRGFADGNINVQTLLSFGKNSDGTTPESKMPLNLKVEKKVALNLELEIPLGIGQQLTGGFSFLFDLNNIKNITTDTNFYIACKMNWFRF